MQVKLVSRIARPSAYQDSTSGASTRVRCTLASRGPHSKSGSLDTSGVIDPSASWQERTAERLLQQEASMDSLLRFGIGTSGASAEATFVWKVPSDLLRKGSIKSGSRFCHTKTINWKKSGC